VHQAFASLQAAKQTAAAAAEQRRAAEMAERARLLAATWDYALNMRRCEQLERRGVEQERHKQQLEQQLATANTEVAALRDARLETRLSRLESELTLATVKKEPDSDFD